MDFYVVESSYTECRPIGSVLIKFHVEHKRQTATDATNLTMMQQLQHAKLRWCDGMTTGNIPTKESTSEQVEWERKLTAGGFAMNGINLSDPEEVKEVFRTLGVSDREFTKKAVFVPSSKNRGLSKEKRNPEARILSLIAFTSCIQKWITMWWMWSPQHLRWQPSLRLLTAGRTISSRNDNGEALVIDETLYLTRILCCLTLRW